MGDPKVGSVGKTGGSTGAPTVEDQAMDILNNPRLSENEKRKELEKTFSQLPDDEKGAMYERLSTRNRKDPLNQAFHYRLSHGSKPGSLSTVDRILKTLNPDHGNPVPTTQSTSQAPAKKAPSTKDPSNTPQIDPKAQQKVNDLKSTEPKTDFGPQVRNIAEHSSKLPLTKISEIRGRLEMASKDDFKKMVMESRNWPADARDFVTEAMRQSPVVMQRIAKEFTKEEQADVIGRMYEGKDVTGNDYFKEGVKPLHREAMKEWMNNTSDEALNYVLRQTQTQEAMSDNRRGYAAIHEQVKSGNLNVYQRLDTGNQIEMMKRMVRDPNMKSSFVQIQAAFVNAKDKNAIIDQFQKESPDLLPELLHRMPAIGNELLQGVNKQNAQFLRETLLNMAERTPDKSLSSEYSKRAHFIKGWIEETFK